MKVCGTPIAAPNISYSEDWRAKENAHRKQVADWLRENGYTGPDTGRTVGFGVCDGTAQYMYGDKGAKSILVHLPYGDAYQYRDVQFIPRKEIIRRLSKEGF